MRSTRVSMCVLVLLASGAACGEEDGGSGGDGPAGGRLPRWQTIAAPRPAAFTSVWGAAPDDVWIAGGTLFHWDGSSLEEQTIPQVRVEAVHGASATDVWAVGRTDFSAATHWHFDGTSWTSPGEPDSDDWNYGVAATGSSSALRVYTNVSARTGGVKRWDGTAWNRVFTGGEPRSVVAFGPDDVWVAGLGGMVLRWDGTAATPISPETAGLAFHGIGGTGAGDVWAVGREGEENGAVLHHDGTGWTAAAIPESPWLRAVWAFSRTDVWVVGRGGVVLRFDGSTWRRVTIGTAENLEAIFAFSPEDIWVVGEKGTVLRYAR